MIKTCINLKTGERTFYGPGSSFTLDSSKTMTVVTQVSVSVSVVSVRQVSGDVYGGSFKPAKKKPQIASKWPLKLVNHP